MFRTYRWRLLLALQIALICSGVAILGPDVAEARSSCRPIRTSQGPAFVVYRHRPAITCDVARLAVYDLIDIYPDAIWAGGTHRYRFSRRDGGKNYRCYLTTRTRWDAADEHPVAEASGSCVYDLRRATRFFFRTTRPYA